MKENIEEVIEFLQGFNDGYTFQQCQTCFKFNEKDSCCNKEKCEELKAIEFLISDYKRLQEEFKQVDHECERLEQKELRLEKEIEKLQKENEELKKFITEGITIEPNSPYKNYRLDFLRENFIPVQNIKDKIEELENYKGLVIYERCNYKYIIELLQDLLESEE